jgi:hypothetical protein
MYSQYYQAQIERKKTWFFTSNLRSKEHFVFDRTIDTEKGIFEFFVPPLYEQEFLNFMKCFEELGIVKKLKKLPNRLKLEKLEK